MRVRGFGRKRARASARASAGVLALVAASAAAGCGGDFDNTRVVPPRDSVGRELYSLVCDRVAAQALREDVTSISWHGVCHHDAAGKYWNKVDVAKLVPIDAVAKNVDGKDVSIEQQKKNRAYRVARIEAMAAHREELVGALDSAFPDVDILVKDLGNPDPTKSCNAPLDKQNQRAKLLGQLADTMSKFIELYQDDTIPMLTGALGRLMRDVSKDKGVQDALARMDARQGYRPAAIALGVARPALSYPRLFDLAGSLLKVIAHDSDPYAASTAGATPETRKRIPGAAATQFQSMLRVLHEELRTTTSAPPIGPLTVGTDPKLAREVLSRPRSTLELSRSILLAEDDKFGNATQIPRFLVKRDMRGFAFVPLEATGQLPGPFVDVGGTAAVPDGLPDIDALGQFVTQDNVKVPTPFFAIGAPDGARDSFGRALKPGSQTEPLYSYLDASRTFMASLVRDLRPLVETDPQKGHETLLKLVAGVPIVLGPRDAEPVSEKEYPPDPLLVEQWKAARSDPPPKNLGTQPVKLKYRKFDASQSPIVDLVHALGQIMARQEMDDTLAVFRKLTADRPDLMARLVGIGLQLKGIADKHPEAKIPANSLLWDEVLDTVVKIAQTPGILEDLVAAFADDRTVKLDRVFAAYIKYRDHLTYDRNDLNGPVWNKTIGGKGGLQTLVDRTQPDTGMNRSGLQKFMQLLHDANGLAACTKDNAIAHIELEWPSGTGIKIKVDYPTSSLTPLLCGFVGESAPKKLPLCGVLRFDNVAALLLDVALGRAKFDVRDKCLAALMKSPLTAIVGGVDNFLENVSGIKGFNLNPTVPGVGRFVFFDVAHDGLPGDTINAKTNKFLGGVLDPVASTVCPLTPFTDPSDGKVFNLRKCTNFEDNIRVRDEDAIFPLELMDFVKNVQPLAASFADHGQPLLFVELFDTMHKHWGSKAQTVKECDPSLPKTDARWCSQDGVVSYEPLLAELLETDLFTTMQEVVKHLKTIKVQHCDAFDGTSKTCVTSHEVDGVQALASAVRVLVDPKRSAGMTDNHGNTFALRNDGTKNPQVTPIYLFIDALKNIDKAFDAYESGSPPSGEKEPRLTPWREARSELVDQLFTVEGAAADSKFKSQAIAKILPLIIDLTRAQIASHCPDPTVECTWASKELSTSLTQVLSGPTTAAAIDLVDAIRKDSAARKELQDLLAYLIDGTSDNDAQVTTLTAIVDLLQVLDDDVNLDPFYRIVANATSQAVVDKDGKVVLRGLADGAVETLARIFARAYDPKGKELCSKEIDPNRTFDFVLKRMLLPYGKEDKERRTPIEVLISVIGDVNRKDPSLDTKLAGADYQNIAKEIAEFCLHEERGLVQIYEVLKQATKPQ